MPTTANPGQRFCSRECLYVPVGTRRKQSTGYVTVKVGKDYPSANAHGWMQEHRYIMEQYLGRQLGNSDRVHHKNGIRDDNRIENLELWHDKKDPAGARGSDLLAAFQEQSEYQSLSIVDQRAVTVALKRILGS